MGADAQPAPADLRRAAMDLLARREHSRRELFDKLRRRFGAAAETDIVTQLQRLGDEGLQSDERFTDSFMHSRLQRRQGPLKLRQDLLQRGIDTRLIDTALGSVDPEVWLEAAREALAVRFGDSPPEDRRAWARRARFLQGRGFEGGQIQSALSGWD